MESICFSPLCSSFFLLSVTLKSSYNGLLDFFSPTLLSILFPLFLSFAFALPFLFYFAERVRLGIASKPLVNKLRLRISELEAQLASAADGGSSREAVPDSSSASALKSSSSSSSALAPAVPSGNSHTVGVLVSKTVFSDRHRFVFFAGVEGTGHHYWTALWPRCSDGECAADTDLTKLTARVMGASLESGVPGADDIVSRASQLKKELRCLAGRISSSGSDGGSNNGGVIGGRGGEVCKPDPARLIVLNTWKAGIKGTGMMSYPNYGGRNKAIRHPDIHMLARLAEEAGVDLRIVVILRDPLHIMVSTTVNRHFNKYETQLRILADNQAVLLQQLREIDRRFWVCHDFDADPRAVCGGLGEHMGLGGFATPWDLCNDMTEVRAAADARHAGKEQVDKRSHFSPEQLHVLDTFYRVYNETRALCFGK